MGGNVGSDLRVIQVGLGGFGRGWAKIVREAAGVVLAAVVDPVPAARAWAVAECGLATGDCFGSLAEALARRDCDAVLVVTPPETHAAVATEALRAGKHVLVEKPLATTLADAVALAAAAAQTGHILMVSQNYRYRAPARAAQQVIADGILGPLVSVFVRCRRDTRALWPADNFRYQMRHPYVLDMAIHHADLLRALSGQNVTRLAARGWRVPDSPYRHDPAVAALMTLETGAPVLYEGDWATRERETSWNGEWEIVGEAGRLRWLGGESDAMTGDLILESWGQPSRPVSQPALAATDRAGTLQAFRTAIVTGEPPETSAADNVHSLAIVLACVAAIESGETISIPALLAAAREEVAPPGK